MNLYSGWRPITFTLSADTENEIMEAQAERLAGEVMDDILNAFPDFRLPTSQAVDGPARLAKYTEETSEADFPMIMDKDYLDKYRQGIYPQPESPFWNDLIGVPVAFRYAQADFSRLYNRMVPE